MRRKPASARNGSGRIISDRTDLLIPGARILLVRFRSLGDILLSTALAAEIRKQRPDVEIDYLVDEAFRGATRGSDAVRKEIIRPRSWPGRAALAVRISRKYDLAVDLFGSVTSALLSKLSSRGPVVGFERRRAARHYDRVASVGDPSDHTVAVNMNILGELGLARSEAPIPRLSLDATIRERYRFGERSAILHTGGRFAHKLWPAARFREVADLLQKRGWHVSLLVGPDESVAPELGGLNQIRNVRVEELASVLGAFELFVGNDSGPMHFAAAAGCKVVGIFGPSDPRRWRPFSPQSEVVSAECACGLGVQTPCRFPDRWCLSSISVQTVMDAISRLAP